MLGGPGLEELFLSRASRRSVGGTRIPVVSAEDLIVMKILAGRDKDKEDVRAVVRAGQATLNLDTIRTTIAMLEEALGPTLRLSPDQVFFDVDGGLWLLSVSRGKLEKQEVRRYAGAVTPELLSASSTAWPGVAKPML